MQLNDINQSLRSAINMHAVAYQCLKQLARQLPTPDESLEAISQTMNSTPEETMRMSQAWKVHIEAIDDTEKSWQRELDWVSLRLEDVQAQEDRIRSAIERTANVVAGKGHEVANRQANVPPLWALMYDGTDSDYDEFWGLRCSGWHQLSPEDISTGKSPQTPFLEHSKTYPSQYLTLYSSCSSVVETIYRSRGDTMPGRVVIVGRFKLDKMGVRYMQFADQFPRMDHETGYVQTSTMLVQRWVPKKAIYGTMSFADFVSRCESFLDGTVTVRSRKEYGSHASRQPPTYENSQL